jgi:hypothetical protein
MKIYSKLFYRCNMRTLGLQGQLEQIFLELVLVLQKSSLKLLWTSNFVERMLKWQWWLLVQKVHCKFKWWLVGSLVVWFHWANDSAKGWGLANPLNTLNVPTKKVAKFWGTSWLRQIVHLFYKLFSFHHLFFASPLVWGLKRGHGCHWLGVQEQF